MYYHRTYRENSDDFAKMCLLIGYLNGVCLCDWSLGRLFGWRYSRWSKESQIDALFEKQAELFFDSANALCGIIITEDFGSSYYILSQKDKQLLRAMVNFLINGGSLQKTYSITVSVNDECQKEILEENGFAYAGEVDITYTYQKADIDIPDIVVPDGFFLTSQKEYPDQDTIEQLRFLAFNPGGVYTETLDNAYKYARQNPILEPELSIILLNEHGEPVSTCMGLWDKNNQFMEIEVVATKKGYENRGFAKTVIAECMRKGISKGVKQFMISGWNEKTKKIYSSFGKPQADRKVSYRLEHT